MLMDITIKGVTVPDDTSLAAGSGPADPGQVTLGGIAEGAVFALNEADATDLAGASVVFTVTEDTTSTGDGAPAVQTVTTYTVPASNFLPALSVPPTDPPA